MGLLVVDSNLEIETRQCQQLDFRTALEIEEKKSRVS
jgi:hypothetical protein